MHPTPITQYRRCPPPSFAKKHKLSCLKKKVSNVEICTLQYISSVEIIYRGRMRPIHSSSPKHLHQNVISGIFSSSTYYRLEIANFLRTIIHVSIFDPAFLSVPCCPSPLLSGSPLLCVRVGGGGGVSVVLETIFCMCFSLST
jgi:hypothetical protein